MLFSSTKTQAEGQAPELIIYFLYKDGTFVFSRIHLFSDSVFFKKQTPHRVGPNADHITMLKIVQTRNLMQVQS